MSTEKQSQELFEREDFIDAGKLAIEDMTKSELKKELKSKIAQSQFAYYYMFEMGAFINQHEHELSDKLRLIHVKGYNKQKKYFKSLQKEIDKLIKLL